MVFAGLSYPERWYTEGLRVMTTTYPIKPPLYAITKSTNYLPNVLMQMEAKEAGFDNGVFIDEAGHVGEGSNMNVAFVTSDGIFKHPKFDHILSGCTSLRLLELARALQDRGLLRRIDVCDITVAEGRAAREMLLLGSSVSRANRSVGCRADWRWAARTGCEGTFGAPRRGHAQKRAPDRGGLLIKERRIDLPAEAGSHTCPLWWKISCRELTMRDCFRGGRHSSIGQPHTVHETRAKRTREAACAIFSKLSCASGRTQSRRDRRR